MALTGTTNVNMYPSPEPKPNLNSNPNPQCVYSVREVVMHLVAPRTSIYIKELDHYDQLGQQINLHVANCFCTSILS